MLTPAVYRCLIGSTSYFDQPNRLAGCRSHHQPPSTSARRELAMSGTEDRDAALQRLLGLLGDDAETPSSPGNSEAVAPESSASTVAPVESRSVAAVDSSAGLVGRPNPKTYPWQKNDDGLTPLQKHRAAQERHREAAAQEQEARFAIFRQLDAQRSAGEFQAAATEGQQESPAKNREKDIKSEGARLSWETTSDRIGEDRPKMSLTASTTGASFAPVSRPEYTAGDRPKTSSSAPPAAAPPSFAPVPQIDAPPPASSTVAPRTSATESAHGANYANRSRQGAPPPSQPSSLNHHELAKEPAPALRNNPLPVPRTAAFRDAEPALPVFRAPRFPGPPKSKMAAQQPVKWSWDLDRESRNWDLGKKAIGSSSSSSADSRRPGVI